MNNTVKENIILMIPVFAANAFWFMKQYLLTFSSLIIVFISISICRQCRTHESLWLFILFGMASCVMNLTLTANACDWFAENYGDGILTIMFFPAAFSILLCMEEIIAGLIGRVLWHDQIPVCVNANNNHQE